jgi:hypothetical protein
MRLTSGVCSREKDSSLLFREQLQAPQLASEEINRKNWNISDVVSLESAPHDFQHILGWKRSLDRLDVYEANALSFASVTLQGVVRLHTSVPVVMRALVFEREPQRFVVPVKLESFPSPRPHPCWPAFWKFSAECCLENRTDDAFALVPAIRTPTARVHQIADRNRPVMAIGAADSQTSPAALPSSATDNVDNFATALRENPLDSVSRNLRSWRMEPSAFGVAGRAPISLMNHVRDAGGKGRVRRIRALPRNWGMHSGWLSR